jgi:hypothetical protein
LSERWEWGLIVGGTLLSYPLGLLLGSAWLLPLLNTVPAYVVMVHRLRQGRRGGAVGAVLLWAAVLALAGTATFALWPTPVDDRVLNGPAYRDEMFHWIRTGEGREGSWHLFLPQHIGHLAAFVFLSLATASALSILLGAVLMNFMAFYVASLFRAGVPGLAVVLLGWQPWALCRVAAFCTLGAVLAEPLLSRVAPYPRSGRVRPFLVRAALGILADWLLKALLAPLWGAWLRPLLH